MGGGPVVDSDDPVLVPVALVVSAAPLVLEAVAVLSSLGVMAVVPVAAVVVPVPVSTPEPLLQLSRSAVTSQGQERRSNMFTTSVSHPRALRGAYLRWLGT